MASPQSSIAHSQATPPPSFTAANESFQTSANDARSDDEDSPARSTKRSHDSMMGDDTQMTFTSPVRARASGSVGSPSGAETPRGDDRPMTANAGDTSMLSVGGVGDNTPSKEPGTGTGRRNYTTSFSGAKIKHLKKADGEPLWRKDIQFDWLHSIFTDATKAFTNSYTGEKGQSFADVYIDAMARSSKTSKILRDKLMTDRPQATNMAMVCLLVNIGRMNTTLNFFPEMRAQLRTYHAIPALQTYVDPNAYKQLQDAPRLKSILKGACEDRREPTTLDGIIKVPLLPRTNPINLVFVLANYSQKVTDLHFGQPRDFFDLVMRWTLSSRSRAQAFLWLMWWYLESDFTAKDAADNPFGAGDMPDKEASSSRRESIGSGSDKEKENTKSKPDDDKTVPSYIDEKFKGLPIVVPQLESLTEEQAALENVDTEAEVVFGNEMKEERYRKMAELEAGIIPTKSSTTKKANAKRPSKYDIDPGANFVSSPAPSTYGRFPARGRRGYEDGQLSDSDGRSMSPDGITGSVKRGSLSARGLLSKGLAGPKLLKMSGMLSAQGDGKAGEKRPRPLTQHQLAVQEHRRRRVERQTGKMIESHYRRAKRARHKGSVIQRTWKRIKDMPDPFAKSDDEVDLEHPLVRIDETEAEMELKEARRRRCKYNNGTSTKGPAGLVPLDDESDDYGEEAAALAAALRRIRRRLPRWEDEAKAKKKGIAIPSAEQEDAEGSGVPVNSRMDGGAKEQGGRRGRAAHAQGELESEAGDFDDEEVFEDARENNEDDLEDDDATEEDDDEEDVEDEDDVDPDDMDVLGD
ncbi:hypothetical protein Dda_5643 [Drechslerella dactyloides]|uniref:INO80 chromatin remodeling complex Ies1 n=1 Tax=Drechslerella dactyloides TaxID=74499 RepID=A0AAD6IWG9_DREDA|nr:hypothetical protein Dda_5643 [Drechslerella dactyloides]